MHQQVHTMMHRTLVFHNTLVLVSCSRLRILAAGGDGTVAWILKTVRELQLEPAPAVAVMPLGTGNDLSLSFGWGNTFLHKWIAVSLETSCLTAPVCATPAVSSNLPVACSTSACAKSDMWQNLLFNAGPPLKAQASVRSILTVLQHGQVQACECMHDLHKPQVWLH